MGSRKSAAYCLACGAGADFLTRKYRKCLKWVIGKKNALGDKPATRRTGAAAAPLSWARLPFATQPLLSTADMAAQRDTVCHVSFVPMGLYSPSTMPVLGNLARGRGHCRARRRFLMRRTIRTHDSLLANSQIPLRRCKIYQSLSILYNCAYHYLSNLSSNNPTYYSPVGPSIFRKYQACSSGKCSVTQMKKSNQSFYNKRISNTAQMLASMVPLCKFGDTMASSGQTTLPSTKTIGHVES